MVLNDQQSQALADALHTNELRVIMQTRYRNPQARTQDIYWCNEAYQQATNLLGVKKLSKPLPEREWATLQQKIEAVARGSVRFSYEALKNFRLRAEYMNKIWGLQNALENEITQYANATDSYEVRSFRLESMWDITKNYTDKMEMLFSAWGNKSSPIWSSIIEAKGESFFMTLTKVSQKILGKFRVRTSLEPSLKLHAEVFTSVMEDMKADQLDILKNIREVGGVLCLLTLAVMTWTISASSDPVSESVKGALSLGAAAAGGMAGEEAGSLVGAFFGPEGAPIGGILGGMICSFVSGVAADSIIDAFIEAFLKPPSGALTKMLFGSPIMYELKLPDNISLSRTFVESLS